MIRYIFRKLGYGSIVLFGAVTVVFLLFNLKPGDPARMLGGQRADQAIVDAIRKDLGLDLPLYQQYLLYLNDLSPLSLHHPTNTASHILPRRYEVQLYCLAAVWGFTGFSSKNALLATLLSNQKKSS